MSGGYLSFTDPTHPDPTGAETRSRGDSLTRIADKKTTYQVSGRGGHLGVLIKEGEVTAENVIDRLLLRVVHEGRHPAQEDVEDDSK